MNYCYHLQQVVACGCEDVDEAKISPAATTSRIETSANTVNCAANKLLF